MPLLSLPTVSLHYLCEGPPDAPVLVLSNSLGTDMHLWDMQIPVLIQSFRVLRYDTRGHGGSSSAAVACTLPDLGTDVLRLLDYLSIERFAICGISLGGLTALWLAIHAPQRVVGLMPCNTAAHIGTTAAWDQRIADVACGGLASIADATMKRWFTPAFRDAHPSQVEATREMLMRTDAAGYTACCAALRDADLRTSVSAITAPTLIVAGSHDPVTPPSDAQFLRQHIEGARLRQLHAAHLSNVEAPVAFANALLDFLSICSSLPTAVGGVHTTR